VARLKLLPAIKKLVHRNQQKSGIPVLVKELNLAAGATQSLHIMLLEVHLAAICSKSGMAWDRVLTGLDEALNVLKIEQVHGLVTPAERSSLGEALVEIAVEVIWHVRVGSWVTAMAGVGGEENDVLRKFLEIWRVLSLTGLGILNLKGLLGAI